MFQQQFNALLLLLVNIRMSSVVRSSVYTIHAQHKVHFDISAW